MELTISYFDSDREMCADFRPVKRKSKCVLISVLWNESLSSV
jgi:hypothetical protein